MADTQEDRRLTEQELEEFLNKLWKIQGNRVCADCGATEPTWGSINLGVLVCIDCSGTHRSLGTHISKVRSFRLDNITQSICKVMESIGNIKSNADYEFNIPAGTVRATPACSRAERDAYIRLKYVERQFCKPLDKTKTDQDMTPREKAVSQFVQGETKYVQGLNQLYNSFYNPLRGATSSARPIVTAEEVETIFANLQALISFHLRLGDDIRECMKTPAPLIGEVFLNQGTNLKMYVTYCHNFGSAMECIFRCKKKSAFRTFLEQKSATAGDIMDYLSLPLNRIGQYVAVFTEVANATDLEHPDFAGSQAALAKLTEIEADINQKAQKFADLQKIIEIADQISGSPEKLLVPGRKFFREGSLFKYNQKLKAQQREFYLFSDCMVYAAKGLAGKMTFKGFIRLAGGVLRDVADATARHRNTFEVECGKTKRAFTMYADTPAEKELWMRDITACIEAYNGPSTVGPSKVVLAPAILYNPNDTLAQAKARKDRILQAIVVENKVKNGLSLLTGAYSSGSREASEVDGHLAAINTKVAMLTEQMEKVDAHIMALDDSPQSGGAGAAADPAPASGSAVVAQRAVTGGPPPKADRSETNGTGSAAATPKGGEIASQPRRESVFGATTSSEMDDEDYVPDDIAMTVTTATTTAPSRTTTPAAGATTVPNGGESKPPTGSTSPVPPPPPEGEEAPGSPPKSSTPAPEPAKDEGDAPPPPPEPPEVEELTEAEKNDLTLKLRVMAEFDFKAEDEGEMSFAENDLFFITDRTDPDWWVAEKNGKSGVVPKDFVRILGKA